MVTGANGGATLVSKLKIATLHCFGSNPHKHATQKGHFKHCAQACATLAEWVYPAGPNVLEPEVVSSLLKGMGCTGDEVETFGFEDPRCWFRFMDDRYVGLEASMASLAEFCRAERPDGIAGYSNGGGAALLSAAAREAGHPDFQSIRFLLSFAGPTSEMLQAQLRKHIGPDRSRITIPTIIFGSRRDPMLANADQMAEDLFDNCELAITDEARPYANHALPEQPASYAPIVKFLAAQHASA